MSDKLCLLTKNPEITIELQELLSFVGYEILEFNTINSLFDSLYDSQKFDDIQLILVYSPNVKESFSWIRTLKTDVNFKSIPVILVSEKKEYNIILDAYQLGISDFVELPIIDVELISKVALHIELKKSREKVENLYLELKESLNLATKLQKLTLPSEIFAANKFWFTSQYLPFQVVGGDIYDYFDIDGIIFGYIADISGHGVQSALLCSAVKSLVRSLAARGLSVVDVVNGLYEGIRTSLANNYLTGIFFKIFPDANFEYINCGHPNIITYDGANFEMMELKNTFPIGLFEYTYSQEEMGRFFIEDGKVYIFYSDGLYSVFEKLYPWENSHKLLLKFLKERISGVPGEILPFYLEQNFHKLYGDIPDDYSVICLGKSDEYCLFEKNKRIVHTNDEKIINLLEKLEHSQMSDEYIIFSNIHNKDFVILTKFIETGYILRSLPMSISLSFGDISSIRVFK
ncbi:MAG: SpoIIE family protein phosphatase [Fervidobacterium sp.]